MTHQLQSAACKDIVGVKDDVHRVVHDGRSGGICLELERAIRDCDVSREGVGTRCQHPGAGAYLGDGRGIGAAVVDDGPVDDVIGCAGAAKSQRFHACTRGGESGVQDHWTRTGLVGENVGSTRGAREIDHLAGSEARCGGRLVCSHDQRGTRSTSAYVDGGASRVVERTEVADRNLTVVNVHSTRESAGGAVDGERASIPFGEGLGGSAGIDVAGNGRVAPALDGQRASTGVSVIPSIAREQQGATHVVGDGVVVVAGLLGPGTQGHPIAVATVERARGVGCHSESAECGNAIDSLAADSWAGVDG